MPRTKGAPTAAEYAVLGVLREAPTHGYLLAQRFAPGQGLGLLYPLEQSAVYALLHDLESQGLISGRQEVSGPRPPRTLFLITEPGEAHLRAWLVTPVEPLRRLRLDFLLKLHFLSAQEPDSADRLIAEQLAIGQKYLAELDLELCRLDDDSLEGLVVDSKRVAVQGFVTWLGNRRARLRAVQ